MTKFFAALFAAAFSLAALPAFAGCAGKAHDQTAETAPDPVILPPQINS
ncbi:hypothetical protein [Paracoccus albus]|nr:hypothetical protein [Paracoccus albus]WBU60758.1 hypothetical protein PAF20_02195 [Paracoccus albus]